MATLSASRRNSNTSNTNTSNTSSPRPSLANITKLLSLDEEDGKKEDNNIKEETENCQKHETKELPTVKLEIDSTEKEETNFEETDLKGEDLCRILSDLTINKMALTKQQSLEEEEKLPPQTNCDKMKDVQIVADPVKPFNKLLNNLEEEIDDNSNRNRACSERSDSGISDCSIVASSLSANLLRDKNSSINEDEVKYFESNLKRENLDYKGIKDGKLNLKDDEGKSFFAFLTLTLRKKLSQHLHYNFKQNCCRLVTN